MANVRYVRLTEAAKILGVSVVKVRRFLLEQKLTGKTAQYDARVVLIPVDEVNTLKVELDRERGSGDLKGKTKGLEVA